MQAVAADPMVAARAIPRDPRYEAEAGIIGAILVDPKHALPVAMERLTPRSFRESAHRHLYAAILATHARGELPDPTTLAAALKADGRLEEAGGFAYIGDLLDAVPTGANVAAHVRIVADHEHEEFVTAALRGTLERLKAGEERAGVLADLRAEMDRIGTGASARFTLVRDDAIEDRPAQEWLIRDIAIRGALLAMYGAPDAGKTFLGIDMALSIATGFRFHARPTARGPVVYVVAEGAAGVGARVGAWKGASGFHGAAGVHFLEEPVNLLDAGEVGAFLATVKAGLADVALVVFDTLARCLHGGDENSAKDVGIAIAHADLIRRELGSAVLLIHHANKGGEQERGSTALRGAVDTLLRVAADDGFIVLSCEKQKDAAKFGKVRFRLAPVAESCVLEPDILGCQVEGDTLTPNEAEALATLTSSFLADGATMSQWVAAGSVGERHMYRVRTSLVAKGYVRQDREGRGARYTPTEKAAALQPDNMTSPDIDPAVRVPTNMTSPPTPLRVGQDVRVGGGNGQEEGFRCADGCGREVGAAGVVCVGCRVQGASV